MANQTCASTLKACALRALRLDDDGTPLVGASSMYVSDQFVLVGHDPQVPDRERIEQLNACGDQCVLYIGSPKAVESSNLTMNLCALDAELIEMLAGGTVITEAADTMGYLAPTDATINDNGVSLEVWTYAWAGRQRKLKGGAPAFWRWFWPKVRFQAGAVTLENGVSVLPLTGVAEPNSGWADGLAADPLPVVVGEAVYGYWLDDQMPAGQCGYQAVAA
jgi:hypothetical protein